MKNIRLKITIIFILFVQLCFPQGEANNWYFGQNAAITFNGGSPVGLTNSAMVSFEGCSTISDSNGNLLFYSDGISVWNRNHQVMPNGTGLLGNPSSTQSGIIVPQPGNSNLYYIFSLDEVGLPNGLRYSIVDISLNNGLGDVNSSKNILLHTPSTEKITAVTHANGNDIWVVTHKHTTNEFLTYLVDNTGLNTIPVVSAIGYTSFFLNDPIGAMKISPDGSKLAILYSGIGTLEIMDFDSTSGIMSNLISIPGLVNPNTPSSPYGLEFSPSGNFLYIGQTSDAIFQFDISNFSQTAIVNSKTQINPTPSPPNNIVDPYNSLQLGPDGKIYVAQFDYNYLGVINNPNLAGNACDYQLNGVFLPTGVCQYGLPPFIASYFSSNITADNTCLGDTTDFSISSNQTIDSISWDFGDGNNSNIENPSHTYAIAGSYNVVVTISSGGEVFTNNSTVEIFEQPTASTPQNIEICDANNDGFHNFNLTQ